VYLPAGFNYSIICELCEKTSRVQTCVLENQKTVEVFAVIRESVIRVLEF
jgi:ADP-glucose pyrophosphorylase